MQKTLSKLLSIVVSVTMVFSPAFFTGISTKAEETVEQMVASAEYNVALNKSVEVAPSIQEGSESFVTDGKITPGGDHAATTFGTEGTYYQIDLGDIYDLSTLDQLVVGYKENSDGDTPVKGYKIQVSANGLDFTDVKSVDGDHVKYACENNDLVEVTALEGEEGTPARYVRLYYPDSYTWGIQVTEIAVLDIDGDKKTVEIEKCADAANVTAESPDYNTVKYHIVAGENQEDYRYLVYLENAVGSVLIGNGVEAGKDYVVDNVMAGYHWLKVIACHNGLVSEGFKTETINIEDIPGLFRLKRNISNHYISKYPAEIVEMQSMYAGHSLSTAQKALDGILKTGEGSDCAMRTGAGSPQWFVIDLGDYYTPEEFVEVLIAYTNASTYASDTKVEASLDGVNYTEVGSETGYQYASATANACAVNRVPLNSINSYTEEAIRFVKITLSNGASAYGYVMNEVGVILNTDKPIIVESNIPNASDVIVDTSNLEKIKYTIVAGENQEDATYAVKFAGKIINDNAKAGVEYEYAGIEAGDYEIKVCTLEDGWESKGISKTVAVDGHINYLKSSLNLALRDKHPEVIATCDNDNTGDNYLTGSQNISAGVRALNNGTWTDFAHHTGYLQTRPDNDETNIIYDLGKEYNKDDIYSVISMYESFGNAATEYEIYVSATGEESTYEKVFSAKDAEFDTFTGQEKPIYRNDRLDLSEYKQSTVRFVKYHIITGNYGRHYNADGSVNYGSDGYHICEIAVMGNESLLPVAPANVSVISPEYDKIVVTWEDIADKDAQYRIYLDDICVATESSGVNEKQLTASAGSHRVKVSAVVNGMERSSEEVTVTVETEPTTIPPTETPTQKPTETSTEKPTEQVMTTSGGGNQNTDNKPTENNNVKLKKSKIISTNVGKKKVQIKIKKVKGAVGYRIKYSLKGNFKKSKTITTKELKTTIKKLKKGKKYFIKVQAYTVVKGQKIYGSYSAKVRTKKIK